MGDIVDIKKLESWKCPKCKSPFFNVDIGDDLEEGCFQIHIYCAMYDCLEEIEDFAIVAVPYEEEE